MKIGNVELSSFITMHFNFNGIRLLGDTLIPTKWKIKVNVVSAIVVGNTASDNMLSQENLAYQRLYYWMESVLPHTVMVNASNQASLLVSDNIINPVMYFPSDPTDDVFIRMLHAKLSTLANKTLYIGEINIESSDCSASYTFSRNDSEYALPKVTSEYVTLPSYHTEPWWYRNDGFSYEILRLKSDPLTMDEIFAKVSDPLVEYDLAMNSLTDDILKDDESVKKTKAKIIKVSEWIPKIV